MKLFNVFLFWENTEKSRFVEAETRDSLNGDKEDCSLIKEQNEVKLKS